MFSVKHKFQKTAVCATIERGAQTHKPVSRRPCGSGKRKGGACTWLQCTRGLHLITVQLGSRSSAPRARSSSEAWHVTRRLLVQDPSACLLGQPARRGPSLFQWEHPAVSVNRRIFGWHFQWHSKCIRTSPDSFLISADNGQELFSWFDVHPSALYGMCEYHCFSCIEISFPL